MQCRGEPGRKRQERHREQNEQVESQDDRIDSLELIGQSGVGEPRTADRQEADEVGQVGGPGMKDRCRGVPGGRSARSRTSSVMTNPRTPSLNPSIRPLLRIRRGRGVSSLAGTVLSLWRRLGGWWHLWIQARRPASECPTGSGHTIRRRQNVRPRMVVRRRFRRRRLEGSGNPSQRGSPARIRRSGTQSMLRVPLHRWCGRGGYQL